MKNIILTLSIFFISSFAFRAISVELAASTLGKLSPVKVEISDLYRKCSEGSQFYIELDSEYKSEKLSSVFLTAKRKSPEYFVFQLAIEHNFEAVCMSENQARFGLVTANYGNSGCEGEKYQIVFDLSDVIIKRENSQEQ